MGNKRYIKPETTCYPLGGFQLLDAISVDPTMQGNQEEAEVGAWIWDDEFTWPKSPLLWND